MVGCSCNLLAFETKFLLGDNLRANSHRAKAETKAEKIKELAKISKNKATKNFLLSRCLNGP